MYLVSGSRTPLLRKTLIGDSMIRNVSQLPNTDIICKPGVKLATLAYSIFLELRYSLVRSDLVILHAGTNDINSCSAQELLEVVGNIVKAYRERFQGHIGFSTIIPRPRDGHKLAERVKIYNQQLVAWCALNGCLCLRTHSPFLKGGQPRTQLFNRGKLHLTERGLFPSGSYVLKNFLRSQLADRTLLPKIREVEARFYA